MTGWLWTLLRRHRPGAEERQRLSVQQHIPLQTIREGLVVLKSGALRKILEVEPINFDLRTPFEQRQILQSYQEWVNSLHWPVQIFSFAQQLDMEQYIEELGRRAEEEADEARRQALANHARYLHSLVHERNLMHRRYLLVVPYDEPGRGSRTEALTEARKELAARAHEVRRSFMKMSMVVREMDDPDLLALFHTLYSR